MMTTSMLRKAKSNLRRRVSRGEFTPPQTKKVFLFREGDLVETKPGRYDGSPGRVGIITAVHEDGVSFDVTFGTESMTMYGGWIKASISR
jgi:hypothetical protein